MEAGKAAEVGTKKLVGIELVRRVVAVLRAPLLDPAQLALAGEQVTHGVIVALDDRGEVTFDGFRAGFGRCWRLIRQLEVTKKRYSQFRKIFEVEYKRILIFRLRKRSKSDLNPELEVP